MIFYLTGPDHSGKSTLANKLIKERKANYIHSDYNKDWNLKEYHTNIGNMALALNNYGQDVVLDRWCLDAYPYRFVNKGNTYDPMELWNQFVEQIKNDLVLIYCIPANEFNPNKREEMFTSEEMITVEKEFNKLFSNINHYKYYYKVDGSDMKGFINKIIELQKARPLNYKWEERIEFVNHGYDQEMKEYIKQEKEMEEISDEEMNEAIRRARDEVDRRYKEKHKKELKKPKHMKEEIDEDAVSFDKYLKNYYKMLSDSEIESSMKVDEKKIDYSKLPRVIACDFDDTLVRNGFPNINVSDNDINWDLVNELKEEIKRGTKIILWTNRTGDALDDAIRFSNEVLKITFDAVNDNIREVKDLGLSPRKVWFTETWDDKARTIIFKN